MKQQDSEDDQQHDYADSDQATNSLAEAPVSHGRNRTVRIWFVPGCDWEFQAGCQSMIGPRRVARFVLGVISRPSIYLENCHLTFQSTRRCMVLANHVGYMQ